MNVCEKCDFYIYENGVYICIKNDDCEDFNNNDNKNKRIRNNV
jgi:hypothetical protein